MNPSSLLILLAVVVGGSLADFNTTSKAEILAIHNHLRSQLAIGNYTSKGFRMPPATNMMKMKWDNSIEKSAQAYANTCPSGHSQNRKNLGENIYWKFRSRAPQQKDIEWQGGAASYGWAGEFSGRGVKSTKMSDNDGNGHSTQMAWYDSSLIGCGVKYCGEDKKKKAEGSPHPFVIVVVCQYSPSGNYWGRDFYEAGKTCSKCPANTKCEKSTGLCV